MVQEWTATATHAKEMRRGDLVAEPTGKVVAAATAATASWAEVRRVGFTVQGADVPEL